MNDFLKLVLRNFKRHNCVQNMSFYKIKKRLYGFNTANGTEIHKYIYTYGMGYIQLKSPTTKSQAWLI